MIRVEFVGGAKKSFGSASVDIDRESITVSSLLELLREMRIRGSPEIDAKNTLVAINGADTSATGGMSSVVLDGDTVSIIPVIHGGGGASDGRRVALRLGRRRFDVLRVRTARPVGASFLDDLRTRYRGLRIQALSERFVLGRSHAEKILALSAESERRGILLAKRMETDILMRFALTTQISAAIKSVGIAKHAHRGAFVLVSTGPARMLDSLYRHLEPDLAEPFATDNSAFLRKRFGITKKALDATLSEDPLEDILVERAAVLSADAG